MLPANEQELSEDDISFRWMALMYPHETHSREPERFWAFFQSECPGVSREEMERMLREDMEQAHV